MHNLAVALSSYNGVNFIIEQLDSIIDEDFNISFYLRDDCSQDSTVELVNKWFSDKKNIKYFEKYGQNCGPSGSFSKLLQAVGEKYIFLSDQDDVWLPGRVQKLLGKMKELELSCGVDTPLLIFSDAKVVNSKLDTICDSFWTYENNHPSGRLELNRLLIQSFAPGCTMLINKELAKLATPIPEGVIMHDWWLLLVALSLGRVAYIDEPTLAYRQHGGNSIGAKRINLFSASKTMRSIKLANTTIRKTTMQAGLFLDRYRPLLSNEQIKILKTYSTLYEYGPIKRRLLLIKYKFFKSSFVRNVGLFLFV